MEQMKKFLSGVATGAIIGVGAALLMAPSSGRRTRKQILRETKRLKKQLKNTYDKAMHLFKSSSNGFDIKKKTAVA